MLAIKVTFLLGRYSACDFRDRDRPEWPPHPERLLSALVAGMHESGLGESARAALLWLESLPPPCLYADLAPAEQTPVTAFVPVNDPVRDLLPQRMERQPRSFPSVVPTTDTANIIPAIWFIWPDAEPDDVLRQLLAKVAEQVTYLGSSRSPVQLRLVEEAPEPNWIPDDAGSEVLRVPSKGRLENLEWGFQRGRRPQAGAFQRYRCGGLKKETATPESDFAEMVVFRLAGEVVMEIETTLKLTDALRAATMRRAQDFLGEVPEILSGHDGNGKPLKSSHAAFIALPFVSDFQEHADGHVLGVGVVLPRSIHPNQRRQLIRALAGLNHLTVPGVGKLGLCRIPTEEDGPRNLRPFVWNRPSRQWASATPVLLDRFPKRNGRGIADIIARSCEYIGLPPPVDVSVNRYSPLIGVEPSSRFITRRPAGALPNRLRAHVTLRFEQPVKGPVLLGAGRYFGLGLMRPLMEEPTCP